MSHNTCINYDLFNIGQVLKFYVVTFHHAFDFLLGSDALRLLNAKIDYGSGSINLNGVTYPLRQYIPSTVSSNFVTCEKVQITDVPINIKKGTVLIPEQCINNNAIIPSTVTQAENYHCKIPLYTSTDEFQKIDTPICARHINENEIDVCNLRISPQGFNTENLDIDLSHLPENQQKQTRDLCNNYSDIFYREGDILSFTNLVKHKIPLNSDEIVFCKPYRFPQVQKEEINRQINEMKHQNIITESTSPYNSPIFLVPKKPDRTGKKTWRMVVDFRKLNQKTIEDKYPIPNIATVLDLLGNSALFSKLDLKSGYWQIEIDKADQHKTAFSTEEGHWHFLRMPFGLKNAPACFARVINEVLKGLINKICLVYLDDIIILGKDFEEHLKNIQTVFQRLREHNFRVQMDKSEFCLTEIEYLGHLVTNQGIKPNPKLVDKIKQVPLPCTQKQVKSFLGLTGYYRKFIRNYATITKPLTRCLKKNSKVEHTAEFKEAFERVKKIIINPPILKYPDFSQPFNITTDASNVGIGAVLSQGVVGRDNPIMFYSRTLNESEVNYSTIEKECLAIIQAVKIFRPYVYGRKFKIISDHQPLQWLFNLREPNSKLVRWRLKLEEFDYEIQYKKGSANTNADFLSRLESYPLEIKTEDDLLSLFNNPGDISTREPIEIEELDEVLTPVDRTPAEPVQNPVQPVQQKIKILSDIKLKPPLAEQIEKPMAEQIKKPPTPIPEDDTSQHSQTENVNATLPITIKPINFYKNQFIFTFSTNPAIRTLYPFQKVRHLVTLTAQNCENEIINILKEYANPSVINVLHSTAPGLYEQLARIVNENFDNSIKFIFSNYFLKDVILEESQQRLLGDIHNVNHRGSQEMTLEILRKFYWPNVSKACQKFVDTCSVCQQSKYERHPIQYKLQLGPIPKNPFEIIYMDIFSLQGKKYLTAIDSFTKYVMYEPLESQNIADIANATVKLFSHYKFPKEIVTDNQFNVVLFKDLLRLHNVKHHLITPKHPNSNGPIERAHGTLLEIAKTIMSSKHKILGLNLFENSVIIYNRSIHSQTKFKPIELLFGHLEGNDMCDIIDENYYYEFTSELCNRIKTMYDFVREQNRVEKNIKYANQKRANFPAVSPRQKVYLQDTQRMKIAPPYRELQVKQDMENKIVSDKNVVYHKQELKPIRKSQLTQNLSVTDATH